MIATADDASASLELGEDDDDVLNEVRKISELLVLSGSTDVHSISKLSISENGKQLAFTSDSGCVGVVDLSSHTVTRMKSRHNTVSPGRRYSRYSYANVLLAGLRICDVHT